ncbi:hypothetical protein NOR_06285 [Metarhizium rileyi]|uniref:Egg shell protein n=2 Tax=Metarhizium rileyi (strain RCEF 4871) TaxID=1649241 RepID=A0A167AY46_METRR|nr:hypothetical protein NOR_06285 [Metarhizium rileyi RCEF 4871]
MEHSFEHHYDMSASYLPTSESSLWSTQPYDRTDSLPRTCRSESGSIYDSPLPASPIFNGLHPDFQSPSSTGSFPSPSHHHLSPSSAATALCYSSPKLDVDRDTPSPRTSSEDRGFKSSSQTGRDYPVCCLYPKCNAKPFKRRADLDRHYKHRHASEWQKVSFNCDYTRCSRRRDPFHRLDHFRDHLREFHKEDIEKRGGSANEEWLEDRRVSSTWWRCSKCLKRIHIHQDGYECPNCKTTCQPKRKEARHRS